MRTLALLIGIAALGYFGYNYLQEHPDRIPAPLRGVMTSDERPHVANGHTGNAASKKPKRPTAANASSLTVEDTPSVASIEPSKLVTVHLANGGTMTGELVRETSAEVVLRVDFGEVGFLRNEITRVERGTAAAAPGGISMPWEGEHAKVKWPHRHDVVVKLTNGQTLDAAIALVTPEQVTLRHEVDGGGAMEQEIRRLDIEQLEFKPLQNERSADIRKDLEALFPKMRWESEGLFTIVTDSPPPVVKDYRRTIRELATDWYLTFYPLLKGRAPTAQQHIVIFENWDDYIEYAATDGVPGWLAVGYYHPEKQVLYCFNMVGERFSEMLYDVYLGRLRESRDRISNMLKGYRLEEAVEGQMSQFLQKLESAHAMVREVFHQVSVSVLRHELTHGMFHNWGLQGVMLSQMQDANPEEVEQKRKYLTATEVEEKRRLLEQLLSTENRREMPRMRASNSWFIEGLAGYMEPWPVGAIHVDRVAELQEAMSHNQILPLEFLHSFRVGSFAGMADQSMLFAYAQSWGLCHFLLHRYPEGFFQYLERLAREDPKEDEDTLPWLLEALGKEQRALEVEFLEYAGTYPIEDPLWLKSMQDFINLRNELTTLASQLWSR